MTAWWQVRGRMGDRPREGRVGTSSSPAVRQGRPHETRDQPPLKLQAPRSVARFNLREVELDQSTSQLQCFGLRGAGADRLGRVEAGSVHSGRNRVVFDLLEVDTDDALLR